MSYATNVEKRMSNESGSAAGPDALTDAQKQFEKFADRVVDVDTALAFIQDAASVASGLWVTYLGILAYLGITVGAVTHADLFLSAPSSCRFSATRPRRWSRFSSWRRSSSSSGTPTHFFTSIYWRPRSGSLKANSGPSARAPRTSSRSSVGGCCEYFRPVPRRPSEPA